MTTATIALTPRMRPDAPAILEVVQRAREGDAEALAYVFDNVFYDVYHHVFLATRSRSEAERVTRSALDNIPSMVRRGRYRSVEELRSSLVDRVEERLQRRRRASAPVRRTGPGGVSVRPGSRES